MIAAGTASVLDGGRCPVLLVGHVSTPRRAVSFVVDVEHREVGHEPRRCRPVPVFLSGLEEHAVARADHLHRTTAPLRKADALDDVDRPTVRVRMPRRARPA